MERCERVGDIGLEEWMDGDGGLPPTVETALLSGRMLSTGEGGLPPTMEPTTDSARPPTTDPATDADPKDKSFLFVIRIKAGDLTLTQMLILINLNLFPTKVPRPKTNK